MQVNKEDEQVNEERKMKINQETNIGKAKEEKENNMYKGKEEA